MPIALDRIQHEALDVAPRPGNDDPMKNMRVCPYFRKNEDFCDVGNGYISAHDVTMIIAYCRCRYQACPKFEELAMRDPGKLITRAPSPRTPATGQEVPAFAGTAPPAGARPRPLVPHFKVRWPLAYQVRYLSTHYSETPIRKTKEEHVETTQKNKGWSVVTAGLGINLALGILYAWSIFKGAIVDSIGSGGAFAAWDKASVNDPYAVACLVFAVAMILAGRVLDKFGPRVTAIIGGLLVGAGFIVISQSTHYWAWIAGFGILTGLGLGFGYCAATPPALKWFSSAKTGLIAGIVVSGFGLASIYIAPLAKYLLGAYGLQNAMLVFGVAFTVVVCGFAMMLQNPPAGYVPAEAPAAKNTGAKPVSEDLTPMQMLKTSSFYTLWTLFFIGAGAGLMVIGSAKGLAAKSMGEKAFIVVSLMAIGNAAGRVIAGVVSDKVGRAKTLAFMLAFQAVLMFSAATVLKAGNPVLVTLLVCFIVFNYGTNLALFPSFAKDYYGTKNYGLNYGILFSAWGVGGFVLSRVAEMLKAATGSFTTSFIAAGVMLTAGALMTLSLSPRRAPAAVTEKVVAEEEYEEEDLVVD